MCQFVKFEIMLGPHYPCTYSTHVRMLVLVRVPLLVRVLVPVRMFVPMRVVNLVCILEIMRMFVLIRVLVLAFVLVVIAHLDDARMHEYKPNVPPVFLVRDKGTLQKL